MRIIEVRNCFRNSQKAMNIVRIRKQTTGDFPGSSATFRNQIDYARLPLAYQAKIAIEELLKISNRLSVTTKDQSRSKTAHTRETYEVFRERPETARTINRIGRDHRIGRDSFQNTIARDDCAVSFTHERARAGRVSRRVHDPQCATFEFHLRAVVQFSAMIVFERIGVLAHTFIELSHRANLIVGHAGALK